MNTFLTIPFMYKGCSVNLAILDYSFFKRVALAAAALAALVVATGCETLVQYKTVEVPVRVTCATTIPAKPSRLTPCPGTISDSQCVVRAAVDLERLDSAVDQLTELLKACQ